MKGSLEREKHKIHPRTMERMMKRSKTMKYGYKHGVLLVVHWLQS